MKKLVSLVTIMALVVPALAAVDVTCVDEGGGIVAINFDAGGTPLINGFGLDIVADDANIIAVTDINEDYWVYPGTIVIEDGNVTDEGTPVAPAGFKTALGGLGTSGVTLELAALYAEGDPAPDASGLLLKIEVDGACTVSIAVNDMRGGVVTEDAVSAAYGGSSCEVEGGVECPGDICGFLFGDPDGIVDSWDYSLLLQNWNLTPPDDARADMTGFLFGPPDGTVDSWDYTMLLNNWGNDCN